MVQRTVHLVAGVGGLAWFTLLWPVPEIITNFRASYAYDDPAKAGPVPGTAPDHPLYARKLTRRAALLWEGTGQHSQPTVFVAGTNEAHTMRPHTTTLGWGTEVVAAGAGLQSPLGAPLPVLSFGGGLPYGPALGAPPITAVADINGAITTLRAATPLSPRVEQDLRPSPAKLAGWTSPATPRLLADLASELLFTANAFRHGLVSTVLLPAVPNDPHGAFTDMARTTAWADELALILDNFYVELATSPEPAGGGAGPGGPPLSLADNVVLVVSGDTPKDPFDRNGWPDGTPDGANLLYVRSNGYLKPGWFGRLTANQRTNFDPTTGAASATALATASTTAAQMGVLFAIAGGDAAAVAQAANPPYAGVVAAPRP